MALLKRKPQKGSYKNPGKLSSGSFGGAGGDGGLPADYDPFAQFFSSMQFDSLMKHFIDPGSDIPKLAMRTVFGLREPPDLLEVAACYARYKRFHQERHEEMLIFLMAGAPSIGGASRTEMLQAGSHILAETAIAQTLAIRSGRLPELLRRDGKVKSKQTMHYSEDEQEE